MVRVVLPIHDSLNGCCTSDSFGLAPANPKRRSTTPLILSKRNTSFRVEQDETMRDLDLSGYAEVSDNKYDIPSSPSSYSDSPRPSKSWNERYQDLKEELNSEGLGKDHHTSVLREIAFLAEDFSKAAQTYGMLIINECALPIEEKTIKPCEHLGGQVGGVKFLVHGILFKFPMEGVSGFSVQDSMKVSGHEIKSLNFVIEKKQKKLCYPLMTMVDYRGFRLLACAQLPISSSTLVYGSEDAGHTIHTGEDRVVDDVMHQLADRCNLEPNIVHKDGQRHVLATPVDFEGHIGSDQRIYAVDFSRLFPPVFYEREGQDARFLYQLFRPEFVKINQQRLFSDSLSPFVSEECKVDSTARLRRATDHLKENVIPSFARLLVEQPLTRRSFAQLIPTIHRQGINVRFLGLVFNAVAEAPMREYTGRWQECLMIEMASRVCKVSLAETLREAAMESDGVPRSTVFTRAAAQFLDEVFTPASMLGFWGPKLYLLREKFPGVDISWEYLVELVTQPRFRQHLFMRLEELIGIRFTPTARRQFEDEGFFTRERPFHAVYIEDFVPRIKNLIVVNLNNGIILKREARRFPPGNPMRIDLLNEARECFNRAFDNNPSDVDCILHIADVCRKLDFLEEAVEYLSLAVRLTDDALVRYKIARYCHKTANIDTQRSYYRALEADANSWATWYHFAEFLSESGAQSREQTVMALGVCCFLGQSDLKSGQRVVELVRRYESKLGLGEVELWTEITGHSPGALLKYWGEILEFVKC